MSEPIKGAKVYSALIEVMRNITAVGKNQENQHQRFKYRSVDDVFNELHSACATAGIMPINELVEHSYQEKNTTKGGVELHHFVKVRLRWVADDGSQTEPVLFPGEAADYGDKGVGKAMQYALKMFLIQTFLIPTSDKDSDPDSHSVEWAQRRESKTRNTGRSSGRSADQSEPDGGKSEQPRAAQPTPKDVLAQNKAAIQSCNTVKELMALTCKGSKYLGTEQMTELRALRTERMNELKQLRSDGSKVDPQATKLADLYARVALLNRDKANRAMREFTEIGQRIAALEGALRQEAARGKQETREQTSPASAG